jgi:hypothetical protein
MPTGFNENDALGRMQGASGGHATAGYIAGYGRQKRVKAQKDARKSKESAIDFENRAKLAQFQTGLNMTQNEHASGLKRGETAEASRLRREEATQSHMHAGQMLVAGHLSAKELAEQAHGHKTAQASQAHEHAVNQTYAEYGAKSAAEKDVHSHKLETTRAYHQDFINQAGGIQNRGFEANPSTGAIKLGVPIKGMEASKQFEGVEPVDLSKYDS